MSKKVYWMDGEKVMCTELFWWQHVLLWIALRIGCFKMGKAKLTTR